MSPPGVAVSARAALRAAGRALEAVDVGRPMSHSTMFGACARRRAARPRRPRAVSTVPLDSSMTFSTSRVSALSSMTRTAWLSRRGRAPRGGTVARLVRDAESTRSARPGRGRPRPRDGAPCSSVSGARERMPRPRVAWTAGPAGRLEDIGSRFRDALAAVVHLDHGARLARSQPHADAPPAAELRRCEEVLPLAALVRRRPTSPRLVGSVASSRTP